MKTYLFIFIFSVLPLFVSAQPASEDDSPRSGIIMGTIVDSEYGEPAIGAYVVVRGLGIGGVTDLNGNYIIRNVPAGTHALVVSYVGYNTITVTDLIVNAGDRINLDFVLESGSAELEEVTVTAYRQTSTVGSVLMEVQRLSQVVSGVSAQQIARSQDGNAAQVMQRIPGVTIVENRFVLIRGLSERYNNVMINNVAAPSTEIDKRTFSFDLISSGSLDRMMIYKSGTPDLPGDFAGGVIKLYTIDDVDSDFLKISYGIGFRAGTTGRDYIQANGSPTDILGFDSGYRRLPSNFPTTRQLQSSARNSPVRIDAAHSLPNNFDPSTRSSIADQSVGVTIGRTRNFGDRQLSNISSVGYSTGYQFYARDFKRYLSWADQSEPILERFSFVDDTYQFDTKINLMSNWKYRLNRRTSFSFKNLFNQIGENETIIRQGRDFIQGPDLQRKNYLFGYRSRSIYTGQFEGNHILSATDDINWVLGTSFMRESEPDLRRFRTYLPDNSVDQRYIMQLPPSSNLFDTGRYYGEMNEITFNHGLNYTKGFSRGISYLKTGYLVDIRDRNFSSRYLSYLYPGFFDPAVREELERLPLDQIFSNENIRNQNGFVIEEGTRPIDSYTAQSYTVAGYVSGQIPLDKINVVTGVRVEYNLQQLNSRDDFSEIIVDNPDVSIMPFVNTTYSFSDKTQLRLAYGRTTNRPEFREIAPFVFYDYKLDAGRSGNPNLKKATIDNIDLRLELYPRLGETITLGVFYKYFNDPIENKSTVTTESPQFGYVNADFAYSYGLEVELRKSLQGLTGYGFLDRWSVNANGSLIFTKVDLGDNAPAQDQSRPLQGQSPYIINAALYYDDTGNRFNGSLVYNIIGSRIYSVGDVLFPTIYEMPRHSLDLTVSKKVRQNMTLQLGIQDILNAKYRFYQDSDRNNKIDYDVDHSIFTYNRGQSVNFSVSYQF